MNLLAYIKEQTCVQYNITQLMPAQQKQGQFRTNKTNFPFFPTWQMVQKKKQYK